MDPIGLPLSNDPSTPICRFAHTKSPRCTLEILWKHLPQLAACLIYTTRLPGTADWQHRLSVVSETR